MGHNLLKTGEIETENIYPLTDSYSFTLSLALARVSIMILWFSDYSLKLQSVTFGALVVHKQNYVHLVEEHCSRSYFSLFMSDESRRYWASPQRYQPEPV